MKKISFNDCTLEFIDDNLGTKRIFDSDKLKNWVALAQTMTVTDHDIVFIDVIRGLLRKNATTWHEQDLALHFIGPLFSLINFTEPYRFNLFAERYISSTINNIELSGKPDELIATGFAEPKIPFFAFQEYKREKDPNGDPAGQVLAAMMAGQALNQNDWPIYGSYVIGQNWYFVLLQGYQYEISNAYSAATDDVFDIVKILKALKHIFLERTKTP